jgi:hypothetical protein
MARLLWVWGWAALVGVWAAHDRRPEVLAGGGSLAEVSSARDPLAEASLARGTLAEASAARGPGLRRDAMLALAWMGIALLPYSFLTYSTQIPSRQTYLASAGLAVLVGLAASRIASRRAAAAVAALLLLHNAGYLWTKKRTQFAERARPTSDLIAFAERTHGHIWMQCFPLPRIVAEEAVRLGAGRLPDALVWTETPDAQAFCFSGPD